MSSAACPRKWKLALFRVVQESLTNIQRHSGSDMAWVTLSEHKENAEVRIVDRGVGVSSEVIDRIKQGKTLQGMVFAECTNACANWVASSKFNPALWVRPYPRFFPLKLPGLNAKGTSASRDWLVSGWPAGKFQTFVLKVWPPKELA